MTNLAPTLQGAGFARSPVQGVEPVGTQLASSLIGVVGSLQQKREKPSASAIKGQALSPFVQRADEILNQSTLSEDQKIRSLNKLRRQVAREIPQYASDFNSVLGETFGVEDVVRLNSTHDTVINNVNDWAANTPEGQSAVAIAAGADPADRESILNEHYGSYVAEEAQIAKLKRQVAGGEATGALSDQFWRANTNRAKMNVNLSMVVVSEIFSDIRTNGKHQLSEENAAFIGIPGGVIDQQNILVFLEQYRNVLAQNITSGLNPDGDFLPPSEAWIDSSLSAVDTLIKVAEADFGSTKKILETTNLLEVDAMLQSLRKHNRGLYNAVKATSFLDPVAQQVLLQGFIGDDGLEDWTKAYGASDITPEERVETNTNASTDERERITGQAVDILNKGPVDPVIVKNSFVDLFSTTQGSYIGEATFQSTIVKNAGVLKERINADPEFAQFMQENLFSDINKTAAAAKNAVRKRNRNATVFIENGNVMVETPESTVKRPGAEIDVDSTLMELPELQLLQRKLSFAGQLDNGKQIVDAAGLENSRPTPVSMGIKVNEEMDPLLESLEGSSPMTKSYAPQRMQALLNGPFQELQTLFGAPLTINDAIAKKNTKREKNRRGSRHFHGDAIDISLAGMSKEERLSLFESAMAVGFQGFGFGQNILHIDLGLRRGWGYPKTGDSWGFTIPELKAMVANNAVDRPKLEFGSPRNRISISSVLNSEAEWDEGEGEPIEYTLLEEPQGQATSPLAPSTPQTTGEPTGAPQASVEEEVSSSADATDRLERATRQQLIDNDLNSVVAFETQEEFRKALDAGEVEEGQLVFVEGVAMTVKGDN